MEWHAIADRRGRWLPRQHSWQRGSRPRRQWSTSVWHVLGVGVLVLFALRAAPTRPNQHPCLPVPIITAMPSARWCTRRRPGTNTSPTSTRPTCLHPWYGRPTYGHVARALTCRMLHDAGVWRHCGGGAGHSSPRCKVHTCLTMGGMGWRARGANGQSLTRSLKDNGESAASVLAGYSCGGLFGAGLGMAHMYAMPWRPCSARQACGAATFIVLPLHAGLTRRRCRASSTSRASGTRRWRL
jgi:hypothetical protein